MSKDNKIFMYTLLINLFDPSNICYNQTSTSSFDLK